MSREYVELGGGLMDIEERARDLVSNTLAPLDSRISVFAVKIHHGGPAPEDALQYRCTLVVRLLNGSIVRSEGRDCDEMLAVYEALSKTMDLLVRSDPEWSDFLLSSKASVEG
jgi:hypothetical protein